MIYVLIVSVSVLAVAAAILYGFAATAPSCTCGQDDCGGWCIRIKPMLHVRIWYCNGNYRDSTWNAEVASPDHAAAAVEHGLIAAVEILSYQPRRLK